MNGWKTVVTNPTNSKTYTSYSATDTPDEAVKRAVARVEDTTPAGELPAEYIIKTQRVTLG